MRTQEERDEQTVRITRIVLGLALCVGLLIAVIAIGDALA